ncbi:MAG TPA: protein kinase [Polyangiaceae bacterium]|jgi:serine/threonine-protein kinase
MTASTAADNSLKSNENIASDADVLPRRFERYTLLKRIARGGMGEVFLATNGGIEGAERPCVVKTIRKEHETDSSFLARFLDEARIQSQLGHPGVAQVVEATNDASGKPYVVVEFIEGKNLGDLRARAGQLGVRVGWAEALALTIVVCDALAHVHERTDADGKPLEIVHRDLSPQNVMVSYGGDVKLIDFGTARGHNRRCQTIAGIVFAKPGYVAPEVANNTPGGIPADLYAVGIMLWELLAGRRFLSGEAAQHLAAVAAGKRNPSPLAQLVGAPPELDALIGKLTAASVAERYGSARQAMNDLVRLLQRAPSMADGDRSVRGRSARLMQKLYPAEPARTRSEFARLVAEARQVEPPPAALPPSPPAPAVEADPDVLAGTQYRLVREIGRGAMGVVYEAYHLELFRTVALKVLDPESLGVEAQKRFRAEARAIAQLSHENLVDLYEFGITEDGRPFYAMELLNGESLDKKIARESGMDYREAVQLAMQACDALEVAHKASVIHRDIKPANLFLCQDGTLKLLDFGVAKAEFGVESKSDASAISIVGTPEYMAPEQAKGQADERSDVYALGAVLYELLSGKLPHQAESTIELLDAKFRKQPLPVSVVAAHRGVSRALSDAVARALEIDADLRFQSAVEFRKALQGALQVFTVQSPARKRLARGLASAITLSVLGLIGAAASRTAVVERAHAVLAPVAHKLAELRAHAVERREASFESAVAAESVPAESKTVTAQAAQPAGEPVAPAAPAELAKAEGTPSAVAALAPANDDGEVDDDSEGAAQVATPSADGARASDAAPSAVIEQVRALTAKGKRSKALDVLRHAAKKSPNDAAVLRELTLLAQQDRAWGEAVKTARRWVTVEPSTESKLELARLDKKTGHREDAISVLQSVMKDNPDSPEAHAMLVGLIGGERVALASANRK